MTRYETVQSRVLSGSDMDYFGVCKASDLDGEPLITDIVHFADDAADVQ